MALRSDISNRPQSPCGFAGRKRVKKREIGVGSDKDGLGCVVSVPKVERRFTEQLDAFARYLLEERGLSPVTISTRCSQLADFFERLPLARDSIRTITLADVDSFIEDKGHQGWTRASLGTLASSLRSFFRYAHAQKWCPSGLSAAIGSPRIYTLEGDRKSVV